MGSEPWVGSGGSKRQWNIKLFEYIIECTHYILIYFYPPHKWLDMHNLNALSFLYWGVQCTVSLKYEHTTTRIVMFVYMYTPLFIQLHFYCIYIHTAIHTVMRILYMHTPLLYSYASIAHAHTTIQCYFSLFWRLQNYKCCGIKLILFVFINYIIYRTTDMSASDTWLTICCNEDKVSECLIYMYCWTMC